MDKDELKEKFEGFEFDEGKIKDLFQDLDTNKDGRIDIEELSDGLQRLGISHLPKYNKVNFKIVVFE